MRCSRRKSLLLAAAAMLASAARAGAAGIAESADPPGIQDNSFLVEEAYNQEEGVIQHIQTFERLRSGAWSYAFTQEWPVPKETHQLSFTIPLQRVGTAGAWHTGPGDVALNYRYQLVGDGAARVAIAPRATVLLSTGDQRRGLGSGGTGVQVSVPVSTVLSRLLVAHWNAGVAYVRTARDDRGDEAATRAWNLGQSFVFLARPDANFLVETIWTSSDAVSGPGRIARQRSFLISPGVRWAYNRAGGLQIVPGIAVPLGVGPSRGERAFLLYLSFEHPFRQTAARSE